jgi:hypothetical protein
MNEENEIDDIFKRQLEDGSSHIEYEEGDWADLEYRLGKEQKKTIFWLPVTGIAAAILLLFIGGWFLLSLNKDRRHNSTTFISYQHKKNTGTNGGPARQPIQLTKATIDSDFEKLTAGKKNNIRRSFFFPSAAGSRRVAGRTAKSKQSLSIPPNQAVLAAPQLTALTPVWHNQEPAVIDTEKLQQATEPINGIVSNNAGKKANKKLASRPAFHPQYSLTVLAASDINGVGGFQQFKPGTNAGLLFSAGVFRRITVSTGAIYSDKPYLTSFAGYKTPYQFSANPVNATADCRMIDVPLDFSYTMFNKRRYSISVGTGLSSYIMLHENYVFNYNNSYQAGPASYSVPGVSKYYFGVFNINATYQRQINSKVGISLQPYLKLPLTNLGYSQVKLQTTGVAVGLNWNLNSPSRP